jgi:hypothetical protein
MENIILNTKALPVPLWDKIQSRQVRVLEQKGVIKLVPIKEKRRRFSKLFGMLENSSLSTEEFCKQKQKHEQNHIVVIRLFSGKPL